MNNKKLTILAVIAAAMLTWAILSSTVTKKASQDFTKPQYLIGNIEPSLIDTITITEGDKTITLKRDGKQFVMENKGGYPVKTGEINELVNTCIDIQTSQLYTDDASNHADLGVVEDSARTVVKFLKADGSLLTGLIVGTTKNDGSGTYIRRPDEAQVYVTLTNPQINTGQITYIDQQLAPSIISDDIESVTVSSDEDSYTLSVNENGDLVINDKPQDKKLDKIKAEVVFTALSNLRFNDVSKNSEGLEFNNKYVCRKKDQSVYTAEIAKKDDKVFVKCGATFEGTLPGKS